MAEGVISQEVVGRNGTKTDERKVFFRVSSDNSDRWQITLQSYLKKWQITSTQYVCFDGTNVFSALYSDKRLDGQHKPVNNLPLENYEHPARVCRGRIPIDEGQRVGLIWLAFFGGDSVVRFPKDQPPNLLAPLPRKDPGAWSVNFQYDLLTNCVKPLLQTGKFVLDKEKVSPDMVNYPELEEAVTFVEMEDGDIALKRLNNARSDEMLRGIYTVQDIQITNNMCFPISFSAELFLPVGASWSPSGAQSFNSVSARWRGQVTNIQMSVAPSATHPPIIGKLNVQDRRFMQRTKTHYFNDVYYLLNESGWLIATNASEFQKRGISLALQERKSRPMLSHGVVRIVCLVLFGAALLLPVCIFGWKWRGRLVQQVSRQNKQ